MHETHEWIYWVVQANNIYASALDDLDALILVYGGSVEHKVDSMR